MDHDTISMLCNPYTHEHLEFLTVKRQDGNEDKFLEGVESGERFPFHNGIPVLFESSRLEGYNLKYNSFYRKVARFYDPALKTIAFFYSGGEANFRSQYLDLLEIKKG
ncbi:MAG: hypothetical protein MUO67_24775, partial [Anaerolineales bacterium]|nr:hypothetical protein [Anaerolineales bacterium]